MIAVYSAILQSKIPDQYTLNLSARIHNKALPPLCWARPPCPGQQQLAYTKAACSMLVAGLLWSCLHLPVSVLRITSD